MAKNLDLVVYYNFGAEGAVYYIFGAEDAVYYQFWRRRRFVLYYQMCFVNTLCIVL